MVNINEKLDDAIEEHNIAMVENCLREGANPNILNLYDLDHYSLLVSSVEEICRGGTIEIVKILLEYGADINANVKSKRVTPLHSAILFDDFRQKKYIEVIEYLLMNRANPNILDEENTIPLFDIIIREDGLYVAKLLLKYGGHVLLNQKFGIYCNCLLVEKIINNNSDIHMIELLLSYGLDVSILNEDNETLLEILIKNKNIYIFDKKLYKLLNPNNPPYLKLGKKEDKYIIYENQNFKPYLLADIEEYKDKKYLYNGVETALFIYWCYKNKLLVEEVRKVVNLYEEEILPLSSEKLIEIMKGTIGTKVTTDYFTEKGKEFSIGYLTVTNWAYNLFYDLRRVYPTDTNFPKKLETEEELNMILKLLDIRYEQFNSDESFNSNQSREALLELLEIPTT